MTEKIQPVGAVIYTDGSARPNPGFCGSGLHGYTFVYPDEKNKASKTGSWHMTDRGYVLQKDLDTSEGKPVCVVQYLDSFKSYEFEGTNNLAEINAVSLFFQDYPEIAEKITYLAVLADSQYTLNGLKSWVAGWKKNNWISSQGKPVNNRDSWEEADGFVEDFRKRGQIELIWVMGHNNEYGNVKADYLSKLGTNYSANGIQQRYIRVSDTNGYHKAESNLHALLGLKRIYFNTDAEFNTAGCYYQTGWSGQDYITGKRTPEAVFSVVMLNEPDPIMEHVFQAQYHAPTEFNTIVYAKLDRIRSVDVYPYLEEHGRFCLSKDMRNINMNFLDGKPVTFEVRAGELPLRSIDVLNDLETTLVDFKNWLENGQEFESGPFQRKVHDVTDHFYDKSTKKVGKTEVDIRILKKSFGVGIKSTEVSVKETIREQKSMVKLPLVFQDDIPGRNTLKKIEGLSPKVFVITWRESKSLLRYATIIQTTDGIGIWSNYFANQLLI